MASVGVEGGVVGDWERGCGGFGREREGERREGRGLGRYAGEFIRNKVRSAKFTCCSHVMALISARCLAVGPFLGNATTFYFILQQESVAR